MELASSSAGARGPLILGIDIGTSAVKLAVHDAGLHLVRASRISTQTVTRSMKGELDANRLWLAVAAQIANIGAHVDLGRIAAIGIAGMAESGCLIGADNRPLTPLLLWHDRRGMHQAAALRRKAGGRFEGVTGLRMTNVRSIAKWMWLVEHGAPRESRWCGGPEWIALRLTGQWMTDLTLAVRTGIFDVLRGEYSEELLQLAGASTDFFPPVRGAPAKADQILPEIAHELGLPTSTQVVIAGHDDIASAHGAGGRIGDLVDSGGTAEGLIQIVDWGPDPATTAKARMAMTRYYLPRTWALIAGAGSTGALMQQVAQLLGGTPAELDERASPAGEYDVGTIKVRLSKNSLPRIKVRREATSSEVWSAVLDLVCDRVEQAAQRLEQLAGRPSRLILIGGAARSRELAVRKATRLDLPAITVSDMEASTRGAAALALSVIGEPGP